MNLSPKLRSFTIPPPLLPPPNDGVIETAGSSTIGIGGNVGKNIFERLSNPIAFKPIFRFTPLKSTIGATGILIESIGNVIVISGAISIGGNTSGVFKGFYKGLKSPIGKFGGEKENALERIMGEITMEPIVLSNYDSNCFTFQKNTNRLVEVLDELDLVYYDPPYNQHPYGSNYHILNTLVDYVLPKELKAMGKQGIQSLIVSMRAKGFLSHQTNAIGKNIVWAETEHTWDTYKTMFQEEVGALDKVRGESFASVFPELTSLLD